MENQLYYQFLIFLSRIKRPRKREEERESGNWKGVETLPLSLYLSLSLSLYLLYTQLCNQRVRDTYYTFSPQYLLLFLLNRFHHFFLEQILSENTIKLELYGEGACPSSHLFCFLRPNFVNFAHRFGYFLFYPFESITILISFP